MGRRAWTVILFMLANFHHVLGGYRWDSMQDVQHMQFPCPDRSTWRSEFPPWSVHRLRPGDIDVVAAVGDSHTAANGAMADNLYEVIFRENRGVSWSIGGQGNWSQYLTVPNLLKVMNPYLIGYSLGDGNVFSEQAQFNVAFNGAMDQDLMSEAAFLISKMKRDPRVDFYNHWKLVTIMAGTNDICSDQCHDRDEGVESHRRRLIRLLDFFYENLPRAFISLVSMPYIPFYMDLFDPPYATCAPMKLIACSCLFGGPFSDQKLSNVIRMTRAFQRVQQEIAEGNRYNGRVDFTVEYQPTHLNSVFPKKWFPPGVDPHDYSYISIDCIHFTQKLHAVLANAYWNNLFEIPGNKTSTWDSPAYRKFLCPTRDRPYLITKRNYIIGF